MGILKEIESVRSQARNGEYIRRTKPASLSKESLNDSASPFIIKTANKWMQEGLSLPKAKQLINHLWVEGEVCVLFGPTNSGKSILAVQIAATIASGISSEPFRTECPGRPVLYIDFELSNRKFTKRYSEDAGTNFTNPRKWHDNFFRAERDKFIPPEGVNHSDYIVHHLETAIKAYGTKIIIIDNISWINSNLEKTKDAGPFMQHLHSLQKEHDLSILILAHTPKRVSRQEMDIYSLAGSAMLMNFMDSAFAINYSATGKQRRYVKQIKTRDGEMVYDKDNVIVCDIEKVGNFLGMTFLEYDGEYNHIKQLSAQDHEELDLAIIEMKRDNPDFSLRKIANDLGTNPMRVKRVIERNKDTFENDECPF